MSDARSVIRVSSVVIDDDPEVCRRLSDMLREAQIDVEACTQAADGLDRLRSGPVHLAFVDLMMPDCDGADVIRQIAAPGRGTRVVALAAFPDGDTVLAARDAGACEVLAKPIELDRLNEVVRRELAQLGIPGRTEDEFNRCLGARLRALRSEAGLLQAQVATQVGITAAQLSQIELGKTATTTWTLARICAALRVPIASVFAP